MMHPAFFSMIIVVSIITLGSLVALHRDNAASKPRVEYIPLCWNQTIPDVPMWHPAARCTGVINRTPNGISLTINLGRF